MKTPRATPAARPQPPPAVEQARAIAKEGLAALARGEAETALANFIEAARLVPEANLPHRYAAEAFVALGRDKEAVESYERYLSIRPDVSDVKDVLARIAEAKARIAEAKAKAVGRVTVRSHPTDAIVHVDGAAEPAGRTPLAPLVLPPGSHTFLLKLDGYRDARLETRIEGGANVELLADLVAISPPPVRVKAPASTWTRRDTGWVIGGFALAAIGTGVVLDATWAGGRVDAFERTRLGGSAESARAHQEDARTAQTITITTLTVGAVALVVGTTLVLWPSSSPSAPRASR